MCGIVTIRSLFPFRPFLFLPPPFKLTHTHKSSTVKQTLKSPRKKKEEKEAADEGEREKSEENLRVCM